MEGQLRVSRALRRLDRLAAGPALAAGLGAGALLGFVCLRGGGVSGMVGFGVLALSALPLALSAQPTARPAREAPLPELRPRGTRLRLAISIAAALVPLVALGAAWVSSSPRGGSTSFGKGVATKAEPYPGKLQSPAASRDPAPDVVKVAPSEIVDGGARAAASAAPADPRKAPATNPYAPP